MADTGAADPVAAREFWLECVKPTVKRGTLEKIPTRRARTTRERDTARTQNHYMSRTVHGMPDGYDRINWGHKGPAA